MTNQNASSSSDTISPNASDGKGLFRRLFDFYRRLDESIHYSPFDYTIDRFRALEARVTELEKGQRGALLVIEDKSVAPH